MTPEEINSQYSQQHELLEDFLQELVNQMNQQLKDQQIKLAFPFDCRLKSLDSILSKIAKGIFELKKSIFEMQDLIGLRFVLLYKRDIAKLENSLMASFPDSKRYSPQKKGNTDSFGYASTHYIISPPKNWSQIAHLKKFVGLKAEIQIRTLSQHIWAECSHSLNYKSNINIPPSLERPLFRLSALMEIVDNELSSILRDHEEYKAMVATLNLENLLKEDLNGLTVEKLLSTVFKEQGPLSESEYAILHKMLEESYEIRSVKQLLYAINKYKSNIGENKEMDHRVIMEIVLAKYKENNYN